MFDRILVAIDPNGSGRGALRTAGALARSTGGAVRVLHVIPTTVAGDTVVRLEDDTEAATLLREAIDFLRTEGTEADGRLVRALTEMVPSAISAAAEEFEADLLVLSPRHRGAFAALLHPRVSDAVSHASTIAVLLAPEEPAREQPGNQR
ncbi:universal stress protein [Streptomyces rubrogriseus]|uniref:Universal stress protein n=1 Tax=Streptomyces rubrogriseus TaxID=194673 RepID=A0A6G3TDI4_9ACTN|nr:universal stress protein [Streptomyces rubrogriseus]NEC34653.1 universal stress protein [Streptomyces rubrogriseus]